MKRGLLALFFFSLCSVYFLAFQGLPRAEPHQSGSAGITAESFRPLKSSPAGLTVDEIIKLREAGISETTIQFVIRERQLTQEYKDRHFAYEHMGTWTVKDSSGREVIIYSTGSSPKGNLSEEEYRRALELLQILEPVIILPKQEPTSGK